MTLSPYFILLQQQMSSACVEAVNRFTVSNLLSILSINIYLLQGPLEAVNAAVICKVESCLTARWCPIFAIFMISDERTQWYLVVS